MPRPNFYISEKDRKALLDVITNYIGMWTDTGAPMHEEEYAELVRVREKILNMHKSKGYKTSLVSEALEVAKKYVK